MAIGAIATYSATEGGALEVMAIAALYAVVNGPAPPAHLQHRDGRAARDVPVSAAVGTLTGLISAPIMASFHAPHWGRHYMKTSEQACRLVPDLVLLPRTYLRIFEVRHRGFSQSFDEAPQLHRVFGIPAQQVGRQRGDFTGQRTRDDIRVPPQGQMRAGGDPEAVARRHQRHQQVMGCHPFGNPDLAFRGTQQPVELPAASCARVRVTQHQWMGKQLHQGKLGMDQGGMPRRHRDDQRLAPRRRGQQSFPRMLRLREPRVVVALSQAFQLLCECHFEEANLDLGRLFAAASQQVAQVRWRDAVGQRDSQEPAVSGRGGPCAGTGLLDRCQHAPCLLEEDLSSPGEPGAMAVTLEEPDAQIILQLADGSRQRRLFDVKSLRSTGKVEFLRHGDEIPDMAHQHRCAPESRPASCWPVPADRFATSGDMKDSPLSC
ncbi:hypothetical protein L541_0563 [Bordetella hinzii CA90 BAL1384]|nr:hypothetical protein L541_0563 [Bordetella hinzii CA90 BAL1384]